MDPSAEQIVHGLVQSLAANVPEGEFDRRNRAVQHRAAARIFIAVHRLDQALDLKRRSAEHVAGRHVLDGARDGARLPLHRALAEAR